MTECESIEVDYEKHVLKIKIRGDIDHHSAKSIRDKIDNEIFSKTIVKTLAFLSVIHYNK